MTINQILCRVVLFRPEAVIQKESFYALGNLAGAQKDSFGMTRYFTFG